MGDWISLFRQGLLSEARRAYEVRPRAAFEEFDAITWAELPLPSRISRRSNTNRGGPSLNAPDALARTG